MKTKLKTSMALLASVFLWVSCAGGGGTSPSAMDPVDYVNPYMGNISHLLVPTFPTVHLPNSMLRVYPERADFTGVFNSFTQPCLNTMFKQAATEPWTANWRRWRPLTILTLNT